MKSVLQGLAVGLAVLIPVFTFPINAIWDSVFLVVVVVVGSWVLGLGIAAALGD